MKLKLFVIAIFFGSATHAQNCSQEVLAQKPGEWKASTLKTYTPGVSASDLTLEKAVLANIQKMIASGYAPKGCQASYSYSFSGTDLGAGKNWVADHYTFSLYILRYLCDPGSGDRSKFYVDAATPTNVKITANAIYNLSSLFAAELPDDELRGYLKLPSMPVKKDGVYYMGEAIVGQRFEKNKIVQHSWLVTYADTLPFVPLTRKEYLILTKARLEKTMKEDPGSKDYYDPFMNQINAYLKKPAPDLSMPAICLWNDEERFNGFVEEGTPNSFIAVKPNMAYYHRNLKKSSPQFFYVEYTLSQGDPVFEETIPAVMKAIDFAKLKSMLGK